MRSNNVDELRTIWEAKCLVQSPQHIQARRALAAKRLRDMGFKKPTLDQVEAERAALEDERFEVWLAEKRFTGFDNT